MASIFFIRQSSRLLWDASSRTLPVNRILPGCGTVMKNRTPPVIRPPKKQHSSPPLINQRQFDYIYLYFKMHVDKNKKQ
jgi:hypothetical protein